MGNTQYTIEIWTFNSGVLRLFKRESGIDGELTICKWLHANGIDHISHRITIGIEEINVSWSIKKIYSVNNEGTFKNNVLKLLIDINIDYKKSLQVKLLSWNVYLKPSALGKNKPRYRTSLMAKQLKGYDILCFQEAFRALPFVMNTFVENANREEFLRKKLDEAGFHFSKSSANRDLFSGKIASSGLLTVSKYPIRKSAFISFENSAGVDSLADKGVLYTLIDTHCSPIHVFSTHTQAYYNFTPSMDSVEVRTKQLTQLKFFVLKHLKEIKEIEAGPIYITGDFNINSFGDTTNEEYNHLKQCMSDIVSILNTTHVQYDKPCEIFKKGTGTTIPYIYHQNGNEAGDTMSPEMVHTENQFKSQLHVDYSFLITPLTTHATSVVSNKIREFEVHDNSFFTNLSDHYGLEAIIKIK
jgi:endonuclease/exonuclease/phosphatase family metal-dependent hydrolase